MKEALVAEPLISMSIPQYRPRRDRLTGIRRTPLPFALLLGLLIACLLGGGSNRADTPSLLLLRPLAVFAMGTLIIFGTRPREPSLRVLWWLLMASATLGIAQLVPMPPEIWSRLPGHGLFTQAATVATISQPWRPVSIAPDMTWNSLASLLVPGAVLLACSTMSGDLSSRSLPWIIAFGTASALFGIVQLTGGSGTTTLYLYPGSEGLPLGFLANRNHQALLLAMMLPLLAAWSRTTNTKGRSSLYRHVVAGVTSIALLPVILATGSRSGLVLTGLAIAVALAFLPWRRLDGRGPRLAAGSVVVLLVAMIGVTALAGRALVFERLFHGGDLASEIRVTSAPVILRLLVANLPFGTGLGTFDPAFRVAEPDALLNPNFFNHAHDDLLELVLTGGIPGLAILLVFVVWLARAGWRMARLANDGRRTRGLAGLVCIVLMLFASLSDYPLRVPLMQALLVVFAAWVAVAERTPSSPTGGNTDDGRGSGRGGAPLPLPKTGPSR